jgi:hypothetical protein
VTARFLRWKAATAVLAAAATRVVLTAVSGSACTIPALAVTVVLVVVKMYAVKLPNAALHLKSFLRPKFAANPASGAKHKILRTFVYDYE